MSEDYLWDKSGEPDSEVERLEKLLGPLGHRPGRIPTWRRTRQRRLVAALAIAAAVLIAAGGAWMVRQRTRPAWVVAFIEGTPDVKQLGKGQTITTDAHSRARLGLDDVGEVDLEPNTKLSVIAIRPKENRLSLARGAIHALIWAPPGQFFVDTPSAQTVDLGCEYTLEVDEEGVGLVRVSVGWVAFEKDGRESFIPADAACLTHPGKGPGIPYYEDASRALIDAVHRFDADADPGSIDVILREARPRDAISLWHLLRRVRPGDRGAVFDRLAQFVKVPVTATREGILSGDSKMVDALWDTLDIGDTSWWRMWKSRIPK